MAVGRSLDLQPLKRLNPLNFHKISVWRHRASTTVTTRLLRRGWVWRGRGARRGSCRVRVVCRAERRRDKFKRKRRSGVMVCVSVFVTHQEARGRFLVVP